MAAVDFSRFASVLRDLDVAGEVRALPEPAPSAAAAAAQLGCEVGAIANSLVFAADGEPLLVMTSGAHRVDTARVAALTGARAVTRADAKSVRAWTGQVIGGVAPVGHPAPIRTLVDAWLAKYDVVWAAAGHPYTVFPTSFDELVRITGGTAAEVGELQVQAPLVAAHHAARRVLEIGRAEQREAGLAADRVGRRVVDRRERVQVPVAALRAGQRGDGPGGGGRDAPPLEGGQDAPARLVGQGVPPGPLPVADDARPLAVRQRHRQHLARSGGAQVQVAAVPFQDLATGLRAAEVLRHRGRVRRLEEAQVPLPPSLKPDR